MRNKSAPSALTEVCLEDTDPVGVRDKAIFAVLATCELRRGELVQIAQEDFDLTSGRIVLRSKGHKERTVYATNGTLMALFDWLVIRGVEPGPLFASVNEHGVVEHERSMTTAEIHRLLIQRGT